MIIKAFMGDGAWALHDGAADVEYLEVPKLLISANGHDYIDDDQIAYSGTPREELHINLLGPLSADSDQDESYYGCRWVRWSTDDGTFHTLVTDGPVYICNDSGATVEALR